MVRAINNRPKCLDALVEAKVDPNVLFMDRRVHFVLLI
jgi:hypothetical protein